MAATEHNSNNKSNLLSTVFEKMDKLKQYLMSDDHRPAKLLGCVIFYCVAYKYCDKLCRWLYKYPSGPCGYPLFGSLFDIINPTKALSFRKKMVLKYGEIYMIYVGFTPMIYFTNYQTIERLFGSGHCPHNTQGSKKNETTPNNDNNINNNNNKYNSGSNTCHLLSDRFDERALLNPAPFPSLSLNIHNNINYFATERRKILSKALISQANDPNHLYNCCQSVLFNNIFQGIIAQCSNNDQKTAKTNKTDTNQNNINNGNNDTIAIATKNDTQHHARHERVWSTMRNDINYLTFYIIYRSIIGSYTGVKDSFDVSSSSVLNINEDGINMQYFLSLQKQFDVIWRDQGITTLLISNLVPNIFNLREYILYNYTTYGKSYKNAIKIVTSIINEAKRKKEKKRRKIKSPVAHTRDHEDADYLGQLLELLNQSKRQNNSKDQIKFNEASIAADILTTFLEGTEPTSMALEYGILYLAKYPNLQENIYNELHRVIFDNNSNNNKDGNDKVTTNAPNGTKNDETEEKHNNLGNLHLYSTKCPLFKAFIFEVLRNHPFAPPMARVWKHPNHSVSVGSDGNMKTALKSYKFPRNALITYDSKGDTLGNSGFDPELTRFRSNNSDSDGKLMIFGIGERDCVGSSLAKSELFLILGILILHFQFKIPKNMKNEDFIIAPIYPKNDELHVSCVQRPSVNKLEENVCKAKRGRFRVR